MCGDEFHRSPALAAVVVELLRRAQQSPGEIRQGAGVAAPVRQDGIAVLAVPFGASRGEVAELVAVRAEIPGLGDQLHAGQYRVLAQRVEEHRPGVEAVAGAAE